MRPGARMVGWRRTSWPMIVNTCVYGIDAAAVAFSFAYMPLMMLYSAWRYAGIQRLAL